MNLSAKIFLLVNLKKLISETE